ncbi:MAG: hypothetical protein SCH71_12870 [Desulfobulbaceae bacterium]|nr:hypothetical protein [Desulfobulbaceae bacterium]
MSLRQWLDNGWLRKHTTDNQEIANLFQIVDRDLQDAAEKSISRDWRFGIAYNAALKLCTILLVAEGYRPERTLQHYRTILAMPEILGREMQNDAQYLDTCRKKRNIVEYDQIGVISDTEAEELLQFAQMLREKVITWLKKNHPQLRVK